MVWKEYNYEKKGAIIGLILGLIIPFIFPALYIGPRVIFLIGNFNFFQGLFLSMLFFSFVGFFIGKSIISRGKKEHLNIYFYK